jgi:cytochrome c peroxidase
MTRRAAWRRLRSVAGSVVAIGILAALPPAGSPARAQEAGEPISAMPPPPPLDPRRVALGEALFSDVRLSGDNRRSCASCHDLASNGASALRRDLAPDGQDIALNTNTVFNAALSYRLDWAGHERSLEEQAQVSLARPDIMALAPEAAARRLDADPDMVRRFRRAYGRRPDATALLDALASFERTLLTPGSRFDHWLGGDAGALTAEELAGYRLFKAVGCVSCHQGVNVGGNLFERHGLFRIVGTPEPRLLRVPSLRNVATTPPYFHDGSAATLEEAVHVMAEAQLGRDLPGTEVDPIAAFLRSLTGTFRGRPVTAPGR